MSAQPTHVPACAPPCADHPLCRHRAPRTWQVVHMTGTQMRHPYLARDPKCPQERHPTRDCGCKVFRTVRDAEAYIATKEAAA